MRVTLLAFVDLMQGVNKLQSTIWSITSPKTFRGRTLTGPLLVELLTAAIATANNSGGVLNVGAMWSAMVDAELAVSHAAEAVVEPKAHAVVYAGDHGLVLGAMSCHAQTDPKPFEHTAAQSGSNGSLFAEHHKVRNTCRWNSSLSPTSLILCQILSWAEPPVVMKSPPPVCTQTRQCLCCPLWQCTQSYTNTSATLLSHA